jgi:CRP/FNR family transcriptional regulator, cyclic AMP receptor protein
MAERRFAHHAPIALQGDPSEHLYLVIEGAATMEVFGIEGQQAQLARHGPGEIFGAYPQATSHRADIIAQGAAILLSIPTARIAEMARTDAEIATGLAALLARQLDIVLDRMSARIGLSATGRFYRALLALADGEDIIAPPPVVAALALSVNTTRETGSRALAVLVRRGIVDRQPDRLRIVSRRMLEELVV